MLTYCQIYKIRIKRKERKRTKRKKRKSPPRKTKFKFICSNKRPSLL